MIRVWKSLCCLIFVYYALDICCQYFSRPTITNAIFSGHSPFPSISISFSGCQTRPVLKPRDSSGLYLNANLLDTRDTINNRSITTFSLTENATDIMLPITGEFMDEFYILIHSRNTLPTSGTQRLISYSSQSKRLLPFWRKVFKRLPFPFTNCANYGTPRASLLEKCIKFANLTGAQCLEKFQAIDCQEEVFYRITDNYGAGFMNATYDYIIFEHSNSLELQMK